METVNNEVLARGSVVSAEMLSIIHMHCHHAANDIA